MYFFFYSFKCVTVTRRLETLSSRDLSGPACLGSGGRIQALQSTALLLTSLLLISYCSAALLSLFSFTNSYFFFFTILPVFNISRTNN